MCEDAGVPESKFLLVDDLQSNVDGAKKAGLEARLFDPENALGSVRDIAIRLSKDGSALEDLDLYPEKPIEFDERIGFVMIKPDGKEHRNALIKEFVDAGLAIVSVITPKEPLDPETWRLFYQEHRGKEAFDPMVHQFDSGEVTLVILRGEKDAYKKIREMIGPWRVTEPGTLRHIYGVQQDAIVAYVDDSCRRQRKPFSLSKLHGSDNSRAVLREIGLTHGRENLLRIFKVSNIPRTESPEEYLAELKNRFSFKPGDTARMKSRFAGYLKSALSNKPSEFKINKAHIGVPIGNETGKYLRLEVGGTNVRVGLVELFGGHEYLNYPYEFEKPIPPELKTGDGAKLFDFFAECVGEFIEKYETVQGPEKSYDLTFIFSFGLEKTAIDQAVVYDMTKEFKVTGVVGKNLNDLLNPALARKGLENVSIAADGNDTESLTAGAAYLYEHGLLSFVLSTGYNIGLLILGDIFNTESGNWKDDIFLQIRSSFDIWLDLNSTQPIKYAAEKALAGTYVGELVRLVLSDMISRGLLFNGQASPIFNTPWALDTKYLDGIQRHSETEIAKIKEYIQTLGVENVSDEDCRAVWKVADMVTTRAAQVVGVHLGAAIDNTDYDFTHALNMLAEGAFVEKSPVMQSKIKAVLTDFYGPGASNINIVVNRDATKVGAAVMAAIARAKSSSAGRVKETLEGLGRPMLFNVSTGPEGRPDKDGELLKKLLKQHGFNYSTWVERSDLSSLEVWEGPGGKKFVLKPDSPKEALAYYLGKAVGFHNIGEVLLLISPYSMYLSKIRSQALIEVFDGITFSTRKPGIKVPVDSKLYENHPELRGLELSDINLGAWIKVLEDPAQVVEADLFRVFTQCVDSVSPSNLIYKDAGNDKVDIRFIDFGEAFQNGFEADAVREHLKKNAHFYLEYCPELLANVINLSDEDIKAVAAWVYSPELLKETVAVDRPEKLIEAIKASRDLIKEALGGEITKAKAAAEVAAAANRVKASSAVYTTGIELDVSNFFKHFSSIETTEQLHDLAISLNNAGVGSQAALMKAVGPKGRKHPYSVISAVGPVNSGPGFDKYLILVKDETILAVKDDTRCKIIEVELGFTPTFHAIEAVDLAKFEGFIAPFMQELRGSDIMGLRHWFRFFRQIGADVALAGRSPDSSAAMVLMPLEQLKSLNMRTTAVLSAA